MITHGQLSGIIRQWHNRKILHEAQQLQKAADRNNMQPIWNYVEKTKNQQKTQGSKQEIKNHDDAFTQNKAEIIARRTEWIRQQLQSGPEKETPEPMHIMETQWERMDMVKQTQAENEHPEIPPGLIQIREAAQFKKLIHIQPRITAWLTQDYKDKDVKKATTGLKNGKAHGSGGIPGEAYKSLYKQITQPIRILMNKIKHGLHLPDAWKHGTIVHI